MINIIKKNIKYLIFSIPFFMGTLFGDDGGIATVALEKANEAVFTINNTWMLVSTFLVFIMHLGFATLETGLTRSKNSVNILFKNTAIVSIGILTYALCGFSLMYPGFADGALGIFGWGGFGIGTDATGLTAAYSEGYTYWTDFIFQGMFAATAATIVSGAVAERIKLGPFLIFSLIYVAVVYPIAGSWKWGGGWLQSIGFHDFAGSTLVHSVGGWGALAGVILLGGRIGKYVKGAVKAIPGHSMPLATIGVFLLWMGWFGFNGGSVLSADPGVVSYVFVTTTLAAAAGIFGAMMMSWFIQKKPDLSMILNGSLAGLVAITAGADVVSVTSALLIGLIGGILVVLAVMFIDTKLKLDDPVGALSVHLVNGVWGTLAVGIFAGGTIIGSGTDAYTITLSSQLIGIVSYMAFCFPAAFLIFFILKKVVGIRVSKEEEMSGLDIGEHGMEAYHGFQIFTNQ